MTKADLVNSIAITTGYDKTTIQHIVEAMMSSIKNTMSEGENVYLRGFGTFVLKTRKAKVARNISKNISIDVPQHNVVSFRAAQSFEEMVR